MMTLGYPLLFVLLLANPIRAELLSNPTKVTTGTGSSLTVSPLLGTAIPTPTPTPIVIVSPLGCPTNYKVNEGNSEDWAGQPEISLAEDSGGNYYINNPDAIGSICITPPLDVQSPFTLGNDFGGEISGGYAHLFFSPGTYLVNITFAAGKPPTTFLVTYLSLPTDPCPRGGRETVLSPIPFASEKAFLLSDLDDPDWSDATVPQAVYATSAATAAAQIGIAFITNGHRPVDAVLMGHGNVSAFMFNQDPWRWMLDDNEHTQTFGNGAKGKIKNLTFIACCVASEPIPRPVDPNDHLMKALARRMATADVKPQVCGWTKRIGRFRASIFRTSFITTSGVKKCVTPP